MCGRIADVVLTLMIQPGRNNRRPHLRAHATTVGLALLLAAAGCGGTSTQTATAAAKHPPIPTTVTSTTTTTTTTLPQPTTTTTAAPNNLPLAKVVLGSPKGFALSHQVGATNGPLTPAKFNQLMSHPDGASNNNTFVDGYDVTYDSIAGSDSIDIMLVDFDNSDDANGFVQSFSPGDTTSSAGDPTIAGGYDFNSTRANPDGGFDHGVIASKGSRVMVLDDLTGNANPVPLIATMAAQQYANL